MASSPRMREEIANDYVPLAFLLGRRASEYKLPSLGSSSSSSSPVTPPILRRHASSSSVFSERIHVRRREEQAQRLLQRVLAHESRIDTSAKRPESESALEPPQARVSTADRRRRAVELQRLLVDDWVAAAPVVVEASRPRGGGGRGDDEQTALDLYHQRELYAQYHGYVPREADFVEVVGSHARIVHAPSMRQMQEDDLRRRTKQRKAKQSHTKQLRQRLAEQQAETKAKLQQAERRRAAAKPSDGGEQISAGDVDAMRLKQAFVKQWQQEQQQEMDRARQIEMHEQEQRHESVQRARQENAAVRKARAASHAKEKQALAKMKRGVGPSFQSTLRIEKVDEETVEVDGRADRQAMEKKKEEAAVTLDVGQLPFPQDKSSGDDDAREAMQLGDQLQARQHELFLESQLRSVHLGGGFASKSRSSKADGTTDGEKERDDTTAAIVIRTQAKGAPLNKSKRDVLRQWRTTLASSQKQ